MTKNLTTSVLAVDIGNTRAKFGLFQIAATGLPHPITIGAHVLDDVPSLISALSDWSESLHMDLPEVAMIAGSAVDFRDRLLGSWPLTTCEPILLSRYDQLPIGIDVETPERVGIDRLLDTYAAWSLAGRTTNVIAVDSGTATTVDLMTRDGIFRGGSILPGLRLSAHAMHDYTDRLPLLDTDTELNDLPALPGRSTETAMQAGLFIGQLGAVRELVTRLTDACSGFGADPASAANMLQSPALFVSGGGGRQLVRHLPGAHFVDSLALHGLAMVAAEGLPAR